MSLETLALFALFVLLPLLLQRLLRGKKESGQRRPAPPPARRPAPPREASSVERPPMLDAADAGARHDMAPEPPAVLRPARRGPDDARERERVVQPRAIEPHAPPRPGRRRRWGQRAGLRDAAGVRRAIVHMTILGPCRAANPYE